MQEKSRGAICLFTTRSACLGKAKQNQMIVLSVFPFVWGGVRVTLWQASDNGGTCARLCPCGRLVIHLLDLVCIFWGCSGSCPLQATSGSSVVNVLIHVIVKGSRHRRLYSVSGILELKKVSYLTDDTQRLWRQEKRKSCQYVAPGVFFHVNTALED